MRLEDSHLDPGLIFSSVLYTYDVVKDNIKTIWLHKTLQSTLSLMISFGSQASSFPNQEIEAQREVTFPRSQN